MVKNMTVPGRRRRVAAVAAVVLTGLGASTATAHAPQLSGKPSTSAGGSFRADASDEWPITECGTFNGRGCAPTSERVDLVRPTFSDPTHIDNPLFPVGTMQSVIQVGIVDGKSFRSETTTLPATGVVDWFGTEVPVVLSQYVAYLDGEITEVALDRYAQADDGSVWYFGEDVIDYRQGHAHLTEGTWLAGRDGPPAMVMPAHPMLGDVFRVENVIGIVFEELTVIETDKTMQGPNGPVIGAIVVDELGVDGGHSKKTLAPGYGEFLTRGGGELEAMAVATPTNDLPGGAPVEIRKILTAAAGTMEYARAHEWQFARASLHRIQDQVEVITRAQQPPRVMQLLHVAVSELGSAVRDKRSIATQRATFDVSQSTIDLESRYLDHVDIEVARFHLHTQKLRIDAAARTAASVEGDVAILEHIRDRLTEGLDAEELAVVDEELAALRIAADSGNLPAAADQATRLGEDVRNFTAA
jgi:hypothetical protein